MDFPQLEISPIRFPQHGMVGENPISRIDKDYFYAHASHYEMGILYVHTELQSVEIETGFYEMSREVLLEENGSLVFQRHTNPLVEEDYQEGPSFEPSLYVREDGDTIVLDFHETFTVINHGFMFQADPSNEDEALTTFYYLSYDGFNVYLTPSTEASPSLGEKPYPIDRIRLVFFDMELETENACQTSSDMVPLLDLLPERYVPSTELDERITSVEFGLAKELSKQLTDSQEEYLDLLLPPPSPVTEISLAIEGQIRFLYPPSFAYALEPEGFLFDETFEAFQTNSNEALEINPPGYHMDVLKVKSFDFLVNGLDQGVIPRIRDLYPEGEDEEEIVEQVGALLYLCDYLGLKFYSDYFRAIL